MASHRDNHIINRLNLSQTIKITDYIRPNIDNLIKQSASTVAQMATESTGIVVNEQNIRYIVKSLGHSFERKMPASPWERQHAINSKMANAIRQIAVEVRGLQSEMKVPVAQQFIDSMRTISDLLVELDHNFKES